VLEMRKVQQFLLWIIISSVGSYVGIIFVSFFKTKVGQAYFQEGRIFECWDMVCCCAIEIDGKIPKYQINPPVKLIIYVILMGVLLGLIISLFQWLILRTKGITAFAWLPWSTFSYVFPCLLVLLYQYMLLWRHGFIQWGSNPSIINYLHFYITAVGYFIIPGLCQWVALRKTYRHSWMWIIAVTTSNILLRPFFPIDNIKVPPGWLIEKLNFIENVHLLLARSDFVHTHEGIAILALGAFIIAFSLTGIIFVLLPDKKDYQENNALIQNKKNQSAPRSKLLLVMAIIVLIIIILQVKSAFKHSLDGSMTYIGSIDWIHQIFYTISPNNKHLAYIAISGSKQHVVVNDRAEKSYDEIGDLTFSPDSAHVAYTAKKGKKWIIVVDGKEGKLYDEIGGNKRREVSLFSSPLIYFAPGSIIDYENQSTTHALRFSPDSEHLAYRIRKGNEWFLMVDNRERAMHEEIGEFIYSYDSERIIYAAADNGKWFVVNSDQMSKRYDGIKNIALSNDGLHVAYTAKTGNRWMVVYDGEESKSYDDISDLKFSPDEKHIAYVAHEEEREYVILDEKPGKYYDTITNLIFSPDSTRLAYKTEEIRYKEGFAYVWSGVIMDDGSEAKEYDAEEETPILFSPDGSYFVFVNLAYWSTKLIQTNQW